MNKRAVCHVSCLSDVFEGRIDWSGYAPSSSAAEAPKESVQDKNGGSVRPNLTADEYADLATAAAADDAKDAEDAESAHRTMTTIGSRKQWSLPHHAIQPYVRLLGIHPRLPLRRGYRVHWCFCGRRFSCVTRREITYAAGDPSTLFLMLLK